MLKTAIIRFKMIPPSPPLPPAVGHLPGLRESHCSSILVLYAVVLSSLSCSCGGSATSVIFTWRAQQIEKVSETENTTNKYIATFCIPHRVTYLTVASTVLSEVLGLPRAVQQRTFSFLHREGLQLASYKVLKWRSCSHEWTHAEEQRRSPARKLHTHHGYHIRRRITRTNSTPTCAHIRMGVSLDPSHVHNLHSIHVEDGSQRI